VLVIWQVGLLYLTELSGSSTFLKMKNAVLAVIPARFASTRLPGKPLADIHGKPMIQWVYERTKTARGIDRVVVATDDERIARAVEGFGGKVVLTSAELQSGTDRVAAVADQMPALIYVNVQGDEPMMDPTSIEKALELVKSGRFPMATTMTPLRNASELHEPSTVKVIADRHGRAIYFSRLPIPYSRGAEPQADGEYVSMRHLGLYVYNHETLMRFRSLPPSPLEGAEVLEQLRALSDGIPIGMAQVNSVSQGVDTPEDLEKVRRILAPAVPN
jgi:3-deoxy-manno-octulosonate cytidylyltransferase (CMP-KDO synthetase)